MSRFRVFEDASSDVAGENFGKTDNAYVWNYPHIAGVNISRSCMLDESVKGFRKLVAAGRIINNPYRKESYELTRQPARMRRVGPLNGKIHEQVFSFCPGQLNPSLGPLLYSDPIPFDDSLEPYTTGSEIAVRKSHANMSLAEIEGGASILEGKETVNWIASILTRANRLGKTIRSNWTGTKKTRRKKLPKSSRDSIDRAVSKGLPAASNSWMEYRYAVRPLIYEMEQAQNALIATLYRKRHTSRGFYRDEGAQTVITTGGATNDFTYELITTDRSSHNYRAGVMFDVDNDINHTLAIWGLDQPIAAVWEATRLSFAVDWFYSIGDWIRSWQPKASLHTLSSWITEIHTFERLIHTGAAQNHYWAVPWTEFSVEMGTTTQRCIRVRRLPAPPLSAFPSVNIKLDPAKIIDLAIIGKQIVSGLSR